MSLATSRGTIITFYSWKGGVGRTMALANIAVQLARLGRSVLMVDWDLEAPGLERYFNHPEIPGLAVSTIVDDSGLLGLLEMNHEGSPNRSDWDKRLSHITVPSAEASFSLLNPPTPGRLHLLPSGIAKKDYTARLADFSWQRFFAEQAGGSWLEALREQWSLAYDFVLIDARTGLTDSGGVCTVQMPDMLVLVFTANEQSLADGIKIVDAAQSGRRNFAYDRAPLTVVPLLSRWCGDDEVDIGDQWLQRLDIELQPLVSAWLPKGFTPRQLLAKIRVPHVTRFSFGEPLPVLTHRLDEANLPGLSFANMARLLNSNLAEAGQIIDPAYMPMQHQAGYSEDNDLKLLALVHDTTALHQEIARLSKIHGSTSVELADFLNKAGLTLRQLTRNADAEPLFRRSLAMIEKIYGVEHTEYATRLSNLAVVLKDTARYEEAEPLIRQALAIVEKNHGEESQQLSAYLNNLAQLLHETNRLEEAEPLMRQAIAIDEKHYGEVSKEIATDISNFAQLLQDTGRFQEAESLMRRALAIGEKTLGKEHPVVAIRLSNLAILLSETERIAEAEAMMRRALAIDEKNFGLEHPSVARTLSNLATLLHQTGRSDEAELLTRKVLTIGEQNFGTEHKDVAIRLNNLAQIMHDTGRLAEAEPLMLRALTIDEKNFGVSHPNVAIGLSNLARLQQVTGRLSEAEAHCRRAVDILRDFNIRTGHEHPNFQSTQEIYQSILKDIQESKPNS